MELPFTDTRLCDSTLTAQSIRLKNQFRSLDEDEVDFLDQVLESTRAKEAAIRKETLDQLELFRRQQEEAERAAAAEPDAAALEQDLTEWATSGRKRKKGPEKGPVKSIRVRKLQPARPDEPTEDGKATTTSTTAIQATNDEDPAIKAKPSELAKPHHHKTVQAQRSGPASAPTTTLGLANYSSDDD